MSAPRRSPHFRRSPALLPHGVLLTFLLFWTTLHILQAQDKDTNTKAMQLWQDAQTAFASGNYTTSVSQLEQIIKLNADTAEWLGKKNLQAAPVHRKWLEPVFFLLGASYFNLKDWPHAITILGKYIQLFPTSARLSQAQFSLAQAELFSGKFDDAITHFNAVLNSPDLHDKALLCLLETNKQAKRPDQIIVLAEKELAQKTTNPETTEKINFYLLNAYIEAGKEQKALDLLGQMNGDVQNISDILAFNGLAERLGDAFLSKKNIDAALRCYRCVRDNNEIAALENLQIADLRALYAKNLDLIRADPLNTNQLQLDNKDIDAEIKRKQAFLEKVPSLPPVLPPLYLRIARAYSYDNQPWEAAVVYREISRRFPQSPEAEAALYSSILLFEQVKQYPRALALCDSYLTQYPSGKYIDSIAFFRGVLAYEQDDLDKASRFFEECLKKQPSNSHREQIELTLGDIALRQQSFDKALAAYARYQKDYPDGRLLEQAVYRSALTQLFSGKADEADKALHTYLEKYPTGAYAPDAEYRLAFLKFADKQYDDVLADCKVWQAKHGSAGPAAEVLSLMGDCYTSKDQPDQAVAAYIASAKCARTPEVQNYALQTAAKILQKQAKWADIKKMFEDTVKCDPSNRATTIPALFWIGRADIKLNQVEEGEKYLADTAKQYLNDPAEETVDDIITQLAQLYARPHRTVPPPDLAATATTAVPSTNAPPVVAAPLTNAAPATVTVPSTNAAPVAATPPATDPAADMTQLLTILDLDTKPTARARLLYAKAELARLQRKPDIEQQTLLEIANTFSPEDLSPVLLGKTGDALLLARQPDKAAPFYNRLMDAYGKSPVVDYAYNGLGQIAYDKKNYWQADKFYSKALDKGLAAARQKDITLGEARTLLALNRPQDAKPLFEQVASNRAWRGEATALSVYSLGQIQSALGKFAEANSYYQRVFVAYQKYPDIQAKAYLASGQAFEKLGMMTEAANTYAEMVRNANLAAYPETQQAKTRLQEMKTQ